MAAAIGEIEESDVYGFKLSLTAQQAADRNYCAENDEKRLHKWATVLKTGKLPSGDKLKRYIRKGIPHQLRSTLWMELSGANTKKATKSPNYYGTMVDVGHASSSCAHQIKLDVPRTFPANPWIQSSEGQKLLERVLLAYSMHNNDVGYCQGMNYVVGLLLLALDKNEESAFWVLAALIDEDGILYKDMYSGTLLGTHVEMRTLEGLVAQKMPDLHHHLQQLHCDMSIIATDWFLCLFCTTTPSETAARIWDALFHEGPKILYRVSLALLHMNKAGLMESDNPGDMMRTMRAAAANMHNRDYLMNEAFKHVGSLPMRTIETQRTIKEADVIGEFRQRDNTKRASLHAAIQRGADYQINNVMRYSVDSEDTMSTVSEATKTRKRLFASFKLDVSGMTTKFKDTLHMKK